MHDREKMWHTADGRGIAVKDMTLGHLVNVLNWVLDNPLSYPAHVYTLMEAEARYRQTILFADKQPYPQLVNDRWRVINPETGKGFIVPPPKEYIQSVKGNEAYQKMSKRTRAKRKHTSN